MPHDGSGVGLSASVLSSKILVYFLEVFMSTSAVGVIVADGMGEKVNNDAGPVVARGIKRNAKPIKLEDGAGRKGASPLRNQGRVDSAAKGRVGNMLLSCQDRKELCRQTKARAVAQC